MEQQIKQVNYYGLDFELPDSIRLFDILKDKWVLSSHEPRYLMRSGFGDHNTNPTVQLQCKQCYRISPWLECCNGDEHFIAVHKNCSIKEPESYQEILPEHIVLSPDPGSTIAKYKCIYCNIHSPLLHDPDDHMDFIEVHKNCNETYSCLLGKI